MSAPDEAFYSEERWENWLDRLREDPPDPEDEESARLLLNLQNDVAIAVAKILSAHEEGDLDREAAVDELEQIHEIVLADPDIADEDTAMLVDGVQTSLVAVFYTAEQYLADGVAEEATVEEYVRAAADAEAEEEFDRALGLVAAAGTRVVDANLADGEDVLDMAVTNELEYGLVIEWVNGLDSLRSALGDPEVIEEEEG
ncbi:MAG: DUF2150 family protein [Halobacteriaceae archaeon]